MTAEWTAQQGMNLMSSTLLTEDTGVPFHELQVEQVRRFRDLHGRRPAHAREPRVSVSRSIFALVDRSGPRLVGRGAGVGQGRVHRAGRGRLRAVLRRGAHVLVTQLAQDTVIQTADTLLLTVPNQPGVEYNAHAIESIRKFVAPELGWRRRRR